MYTLVLLLLAAFSLYIGAWAFVRWDASWLRGLNLLPVQILIIALTAIFLLGALLLILHFLKNQEDKTLKRLAFFLIALLGAGQLIFLLVIQPMLRYDPLKVFDMAV